MKHPVDIFVELGTRLADFGRDARSQRAMAEACRQNPWFLPGEITQAVEAIRTEFLDREKLHSWLAEYNLSAESRQSATLPPCSVLVIMAGNLPLVGFFDLLCVVAAGHRCQVKPSTKDTVLMSYVIDLLKEIEPQVPVTLLTDEMRTAPFCQNPVLNGVIATGSDNANRYFRAAYADIPTLLRGNRHSVAVLAGDETPEQLAALAHDIFSYSGLGCRNVSLLFVPRGWQQKSLCPLPFALCTNPKYLNNYRQRKATRTLTGQPFDDLGFALLIPQPDLSQAEFPTALSEISVVEYDEKSQVETWLQAHAGEIQCVVSNVSAEALKTPTVPFGTSQRPTLTDYPDRRDVMKFLSDCRPKNVASTTCVAR